MIFQSGLSNDVLEIGQIQSKETGLITINQSFTKVRVNVEPSF